MTTLERARHRTYGDDMTATRLHHHLRCRASLLLTLALAVVTLVSLPAGG
jgi:hypothetical protein